MFWRAETSKVAFYLYNESGMFFGSFSDQPVTDTGWHHYVGMFNGTHVVSYVDGVRQAHFTEFIGDTVNGGSNKMRVGLFASGTRSWNGTLDDFVVWNRSLSDAEISGLFNTGPPEFLGGSYESLEISLDDSYDTLLPSWIESDSGADVEFSVDGLSWCGVGDGVSVSEPQCGLPASSFYYRVNFTSQTDLDLVSFVFSDGGVPPVLNRTIYVDNSLTVDCIGDYDPLLASGDGRCVGGTGVDAYVVIQDAANVVVAGDTVLVRGGTYTQSPSGDALLVIDPNGCAFPRGQEGTVGNPITIRNYGNEEVIFDPVNSNHGLLIRAAGYIDISGITFRNASSGGISIVGAYNVNIDNSVFKNNVIHGFGAFNGCAGFSTNNPSGRNRDIVISNSHIDSNGNHGLYLYGNSSENIVVEDSTSTNNGIFVNENGGGITSSDLNTNITFRRNIIYKQISSGTSAAANFNSTIEDTFSWKTTRLADASGDAEGRGMVVAKNNGGGSRIVRGVSFDHPLYAVGVENHRGAELYDNLAFDSGACPVPTPPGWANCPSNGFGLLSGGTDNYSVINNVAVDNNADFVLDSNGDNSNNLCSDGSCAGYPGDIANVDSSTLFVDLQAAKDLAAFFETDYANNINDVAYKQAFRDQMKVYLSPAPGSDLIDNGKLIVGYHCAVNEETNPNQLGCVEWFGTAPDIGPFEFLGEVSGAFSNAQVNPVSGTINTGFVYGVDFTDPNSGVPQQVQVLVDGTPVTMGNTTSCETGTCSFVASRSGLQKSIVHSYSFSATDSQNGGHSSSTFVGPDVFNSLPVVRFSVGNAVLYNQEFTLSGSPSFDYDPEDTLSFEWTQIGGTNTVSIQDSSSVVTSFIAPGVGDTLTFNLDVTDTEAGVSSSTFDVVVRAAVDTIYVDNQLSADCLSPSHYDPTLGQGDVACVTGAGDEAYKVMNDAEAVVLSGDTVLVRQGTYTDIIHKAVIDVSTSGTENGRITFKNYDDELVILDAQNINNWCVYIGVNDPPYGSGSYVTIDGFECINTAGDSGSSAGVLVIGPESAIVRNMHIYDTLYLGIRVEATANNTIIEYNHIHDSGTGGITARVGVSDGTSYVPLNTKIRWNYVHHQLNTITPENADAISSSQADYTTIEHNVVHHTDDDGIDNSASSNTIIRYNIAYAAKATPDPIPGGNDSGDGNGIKMGTGTSFSHNAGYNIMFDNAAWGMEVEFEPADNDSLIYHNLAFGNEKGFTFGGNDFAIKENNIAFGNNINDGQGNIPGNADPLFANTGLLDIDVDGNDNPDILDLCENNLPDVEQVILCYKDAMRQIFGLQAGSIAINNGTFIPGVNDVVCGVGEDQNCYLGSAPDMGAFEFIPVGGNQPPTVSPIGHDAVDVDPVASGLQVYVGTTVTYNGSASDPEDDTINWQWIYTFDGGDEIPFSSGNGTIQDVVFPYGPTPVTYVWILRVNDGINPDVQSTLQVDVLALPPSCVDVDGDGYGANGDASCDFDGVDCNDGDFDVNPGAAEICNGVDDNCDGTEDETGDALCADYSEACIVNSCNGVLGCSYSEVEAVCDNTLFCDGTEDCSISAIDEGTADVNGCVTGITVDCSAGDISGVNSCTNSPDDIDTTLDFREGFTSVCVEDVSGALCTTGDTTITFTCDINQCGAGCESDNECVGLEVCNTQCACSGVQCNAHSDCSAGDYCDVAGSCVSQIDNGLACDSGTRPVVVNEVQDGVCSSGSCNLDYNGDEYCASSANACVHLGIEFNDGDTALDCFSISSERVCNLGTWEEGTNCDDSLFCTVGDVCNLGTGQCVVNTARDCSDEYSCTIDSCDEDLDSCSSAEDDGYCVVTLSVPFIGR